MSINEPRVGSFLVGAPPSASTLSDDERALLHAYRQGALGPMQAATPPRSPLRIMFAAIGALIGLLLVSILVVVLLTMVQFVTVTNQTAGSLSDRANQAVAATGKTIGAAAQDIADRVNPSHPPRQALAQDAEFEGLRLLKPGDTLGETGEYVFRLDAIRRRDGATTPDTAQYAVIKRQYRVPRETKVLGLTVRTDRGETDHYLDKGESFRIGRDVFKLNWVAADRAQAAIVQYRSPAQVTAPLDFAYD